MDFMKWLSSFDELLYEVMSWLIFYPLTLLRTISRPLMMMTYSSEELEQTDAEQYEDVLRPPLFLVLSLLVSHGIELATGNSKNTIIASNRGLDQLVDDETSLLVLRVLLFSLLPLAMSARLVHRRHHRLTRRLMRPPFYAQCYLAGSLGLLIGIASLLRRASSPLSSAIGGGAIVIGLGVYLTVQARWFSAELAEGALRGLYDASFALTAAAIVFLTTAFLLVQVN